MQMYSFTKSSSRMFILNGIARLNRRGNFCPVPPENVSCKPCLNLYCSVRNKIDPPQTSSADIPALPPSSGTACPRDTGFQADRPCARKKRRSFDRCSLHIEHNADALFFPRIRPFQFQHDRTGKVLIPQILGFIIFADIDHTAQILDQRTVGIIGGRFVEKPSSVRIRIKYDLQCVQHRRFSASRMSGKKIDPLIQRQYFLSI